MFKDRTEAGRKLAGALKPYANQHPVILALPRGGIVLGATIAKLLQAPLDLVLVKKIGHPFDPEYAIGAVAEEGEPIFEPTEAAALDKTWLERAVQEAREIIAARRSLYLGGNEPLALKDKIVILVDDGVATGLSMQAAIQAVRQQKPKRIVIAVPVAPTDTLAKLHLLVDEIVVLLPPEDFLGAVGSHYTYFPQVSDQEVISLLSQSQAHKFKRPVNQEGRPNTGFQKG